MTSVRKPVTALLLLTFATAGAGALIAHALNLGTVRPVAELAGVPSAAALLVWMVRHRVGPLDLLIRALLFSQALLLGLREELGAAWVSLLENHAERLQRVRARHVGGER